MNREIKFRAWDKHKKKMYYDLKIEPIVPLSINTFFLEATGLNWMQYTGLKDKNGKEIYDGDVIYDERKNKYKGYVICDRGAFRLKRFKKLKDSWLNDLALWHYTKFPHGVVGNIYENPELLDKQ